MASFREVQWDSFLPNFFMVFSPGVLDDSTGTYITSVHIPREQRSMLIEFMRKFPEVTAIDLEAILTQVRGVMDKATLAVQYVFGFTLLAGITVLLAAIQRRAMSDATKARCCARLGASRRVVLQGVAAEFTTLGLLVGHAGRDRRERSGLFPGDAAVQSGLHVRSAVWVVGLVAGTLLVGVSGTLATRSVVNHPPIATLRGGIDRIANGEA